MKKLLNIFFVAFAPIILLVMFFYSRENIQNKSFKLSEVNIKTDQHQFVTKDLVKSLLYDFIVDSNGKALKINQVSFEKIEKILSSHSSIRSVNIYSDINGNVTIDVTPKTPLARVYNNSDVYYIDNFGEKMELSTAYTSRSLIVTGDLNSLSQLEVFRICKYIYEDDFLRNQITSIDILNSELSIFTRNGELIEFGRVKDIHHKFKKLKLFYENVNGDFSILNLKYNNQIICKNS